MSNINRYPRQYTVLRPRVWQFLFISKPRVIKCVLTRKSVDIWFINSVVGQLINSEFSLGQTDIFCCYLPELPPLTQTGLAPKWSIFRPKVIVSRLIFLPKHQKSQISLLQECDFGVLAGKLAWKQWFLAGNFYKTSLG